MASECIHNRAAGKCASSLRRLAPHTACTAVLNEMLHAKRNVVASLKEILPAVPEGLWGAAQAAPLPHVPWHCSRTIVCLASMVLHTLPEQLVHCFPRCLVTALEAVQDSLLQGGRRVRHPDLSLEHKFVVFKYFRKGNIEFTIA